MRTKEEILKDIEPLESNYKILYQASKAEKVIVEVLLDIRELLKA